MYVYKLGDYWFIWWYALYRNQSWWRHQMETFSALLALCAGNSPAPVNSPHKGQWREALMFTLICARINDWVNNREAGDLRRHRGHYDVNVIIKQMLLSGTPSRETLMNINQKKRRLKKTYLKMLEYVAQGFKMFVNLLFLFHSICRSSTRMKDMKIIAMR